MNDEYLWNKTGSDHEIERLENALAAYRYGEVVVPVLPRAETATRSASLPFWRITWRGLSFAAFAAVISIAALAWLQISRDAPIVAPDIVFVSGPETPLTDGPVAPTTQEIRISEPPGRRYRNGSGKINPTTASVIRRVRTKDSAPKDSVAALSDEEKYAYHQLMLALSITGSKLKIVQDTIDGTEDRNDDASKNQR
jgi:hypothetical protein